MQDVREETEKEIALAIEKSRKTVPPKLQKMQTKLNECVKEKKFLDDVSTKYSEL